MKYLALLALLAVPSGASASAISIDFSGSVMTELHSADPFYVDYFSAPGFTNLISEVLYQGGDYDITYGNHPYTTEIGWQNLYGNPHVAAFYEPTELLLTQHEGAVPETSTWLMMMTGFGMLAYSAKRKKVPAFVRA